MTSPGSGPAVGSGPPAGRGFARLLAGLDRRRFARLLAALWRARGRQATATPDRGRVEVADGPTILVHAPPRGLPAVLALRRIDPDDADRVATTAPAVAARLRERGHTVVGPETVRKALLYDCDRATADALCRDHLGRPLDAPGPRRPDAGRTLGAAAALALAALLVVAGVGGALDGPAGVPGSDAPAGDAAVASPRTAAATSPPATAARATARAGFGLGANATDRVTRIERPPPGLSADGVTDVRALARAHARAVGERSYRWELSYREYTVNDRFYVPVARVRTVRAAGPRTYRSTVGGWGSVADRSLPEQTRVAYADGEHRYVRRLDANGTPRIGRTPVGSTDRFALRAAGHVRRALSAERTDVIARVRHDDRPVYRVVARGSVRPDVEGYNATALVAPSGLVHTLRVSYVRTEPRRIVTLSFDYDGLDTTTARPPGWYPPGNVTATTTSGSNATPVSAPRRDATPARAQPAAGRSPEPAATSGTRTAT